MSQSIFLALLKLYDANGEILSTFVSYSYIAIFYAINIGSATLLVAFAMGFRRYEAGIPLVGNCSVAISAHVRLLGDTNDSWLPMKWRVIDRDNAGDIGHCSFGSLDITEP